MEDDIGVEDGGSLISFRPVIGNPLESNRDNLTIKQIAFQPR